MATKWRHFVQRQKRNANCTINTFRFLLPFFTPCTNLLRRLACGRVMASLMAVTAPSITGSFTSNAKAAWKVPETSTEGTPLRERRDGYHKKRPKGQCISSSSSLGTQNVGCGWEHGKISFFLEIKSPKRTRGEPKNGEDIGPQHWDHRPFIMPWFFLYSAALYVYKKSSILSQM